MAFPDTPLDIRADVWLGALGWVELPVRTADGGGGVKIKRDRKPGSVLPDPGTCSLVVDDPVGDWSPRNPRGQYFGLIGRNTPLRVSFDGRASWRFYGEVASWSPRWSVSEQDRTVSIECAGMLRRLLASNVPPRSAMRRTYGASGPVAYLPLEDGVSSTQAASDISGHPAGIITGSATYAEVADYTWGTADEQTVRFGTGRVLDLKAGASVTATVPADVTAATASAWTIAVSAMTDYNFTSGDVVLLDVATPGGTFVRWQLWQREGSGGGLFGYELVAYDAAGTATVVQQQNGLTLTFVTHRVSVWQSGSSIRAAINGAAFSSVTGTLAGITSLGVNTTGVTTTAESMPFGHLAAWAAQSAPFDPRISTDVYGRTVYGPYLSYWRETATERLARLCAEQGVPLTMVAPSADYAVPMGWQAPGTFGDLVAACVDADGGLLLEDRAALGLVYLPRAALYNQTPAVQLSYAAGHVAPPFAPVDDDDQVENDVTVERVDGSSARSVEQAGPLSVLPPPDGVGTYAQTYRLGLLADSQLADHAGWLRHLGTVGGARYDAITVQLDGEELAADPARAAAAAGVDGGDLVELVDLPAWVPPGPARVMIAGYEETADSYTWSITYTAGPAAGWTVAKAGTTRAGATGTTLTVGVSATDTALPITSTVSNGRWTTDPAAFPFDVLLGDGTTGEVVRLSGITGSGLSQTANVAAGGRARNGVSRAWPAGTSVTIVDAAVAAL